MKVLLSLFHLLFETGSCNKVNYMVHWKSMSNITDAYYWICNKQHANHYMKLYPITQGSEKFCAYVTHG